MSDDHIGVKIDGIIYVKLDDVKPMRAHIEKLEAANLQQSLIKLDDMRRIEKLEAALRHCINALRQYEMGDDRPRGPAGPVRPWLLGAMDNAIQVLEGKDD